MPLDPHRWQCRECDAYMHEVDMLTAPNPFDPKDTLVGCPNCKSVGSFREICDEAGCNDEATCGFPAKDSGYRRTCYDHSCFKHPELKGT